MGVLLPPILPSHVNITTTPPLQLPPDATHLSNWVYLFAMTTWSATILVGAVGNVLLCVSIGLTPSLHTAMNTYVFSIGMVDLVTCLGLLPLRLMVQVVEHAGTELPTHTLDIEFFLRVFTDVNRLLLLKALTFERYQAIAFPLAATKTQARRRAKITIAIHCLLSLGAAGLAVSFLCDSTLPHHCRDVTTPMTSPPSSSSSNTSQTTSRTSLQYNDITTTTSNNNNNSNNTTTTIIPVEVISQDWGLLELYLELPLTIVTVIIILASYSFILVVSRQQNNKFNNNNNNNNNNSNIGLSRRTKRNRISPAPEVVPQSQKPSGTSTSRQPAGVREQTTPSHFVNILEPSPSHGPDRQSPVFHRRLRQPASTRHVVSPVSWSEATSARWDNAAYRKYSVPDDMRYSQIKTVGDSGQYFGASVSGRSTLTKAATSRGNPPEGASVGDREETVTYTTVEHSTTRHNSPEVAYTVATSNTDTVTLGGRYGDGSDKPGPTADKATDPNGSRPWGEHPNVDDRSQDSSTAGRGGPATPNGDQTATTVDVYEMDGTKHSTEVPATATRDSQHRLEGAVCLMTNKNRLLGRRRVEVKAAFKVVFLFGCFVCFWMPLPVAIAVMQGHVTAQRYGTFTNATAVLSSLATSTAAMDSIVYGLLNKSIVDGLRTLAKTCRRRLSALWAPQ